MYDVNFPRDILNGSKDNCDFSFLIGTTGDTNIPTLKRETLNRYLSTFGLLFIFALENALAYVPIKRYR